MQSPIRKVKLMHVTGEDTLRGMLKEAETRRRGRSCQPVHAVVGNQLETTWPTDDANGNLVSARGEVWGTGEQVQYRFVGHKVKMIGVQLNCKPYMNTIDQEHKASMNELTKMMAQLRQDCDASKRFLLRFRKRREHSRRLLTRRRGWYASRRELLGSSADIAAQRGLVKEIVDQRLESVRSARNVRAYATGVRRIRDRFEVDVQNQFDWSDCAERSGNCTWCKRQWNRLRTACEARSSEKGSS